MSQKKKNEPMLDPATATRDQVEKSIIAWRAKREERLAQDKVAKKLKEQEEAHKGFILEAFKQQKFEGMLIGERITGLTDKTVPAVCDKEQLMAYIRETGELDLLQFRLSTAAVDERKVEGVSVPGTEYIKFYDLFDKKV